MPASLEFSEGARRRAAACHAARVQARGEEIGGPETEAEPCQLPIFLQRLVGGLEELDPFALDARLRRVARLEQRRDRR